MASDAWSDMEEEEIRIQSKMGNLAITDPCYGTIVDLFEKPRRLMYTDGAGHLQLDGPVLSALSHIDKKISVVGVCGIYRSGKSYLMNWIAGEKSGFHLGDTIQSETKGIWIWCKNHPIKSDQVLVLLDTEGLGDPEKGDPDHDNKLFCLTLLMSSTLILNVKNVFDFDTLDKLAFIATLSENIQILDDEAENKQNAKAMQVATPTLVVCVRDFYLKNTKDGKHQTPTEYLENSLKSVDVSTLQQTRKERQLRFNNIKRCIKDYFPNRTCFLVAQPTMAESLQNIENLDEKSLNESFVQHTKDLQKYVYEREPKYICNASKKPLDGADFISLITSYVNSLRQGRPVKCQDAYEQACILRNERVLQKVLIKFKTDMEKFKNISNKEELQNKFLKVFESTKVAYRDSSLLYRQNEYEENLETEMKDYLDTMKNEITKTCMEMGTKKLSEMYGEMFNKNGSRYLVGATAYSNYEADMEKLKKDFFEANKLYDQDVLFQCFDAFTKSKADVKMVTYRISTEHKYKDQYDQIHNEINRRMGGQLEYIFLEEQMRRNEYLERELAQLRLNNVELYKYAKRERQCSIM